MTIVNHRFLLLFIYVCIELTQGEIFPFFIDADRIFIKCADGQLESFDSSINISSTCIQTTELEQFQLFQFYIQCPDERLYLEYNRTFTFNAQVPEYSMASLQPHCFLGHANQQQSIPYQTRYTSENGTFTQIISFQCQHNISMLTDENSKIIEQYYLFFKLMNYGLCRYTIQFMYSNGKCSQFHQQIYKIQGQIKDSICYYQLAHHLTEIPLEYFDNLISANHSSDESSFHSTKSSNRTILIITISITAFCLLLCVAIFIAMCQFGLFRQ